MSDQINEVFDRYLLEQGLRAYEQYASAAYVDKHFKVIFEAAKKHLETLPKPPKFVVTTIKDRSGETVQVKEFDTFFEARRHLTASMENGCVSSKITRIDPEHTK